MRYLLDTHIVLWVATNSSKLTNEITEIVLNDEIEKYVSVVSCWEVAIKTNLSKLKLEGGVGEFYNIVYSNGFELIPIEDKHLRQLEHLKISHKDPFDRLLLATSIAEEMVLVTADEKLLKTEKLKEEGILF
jgi:PIN domain nuclease of toxin-antitoxin system